MKLPTKFILEFYVLLIYNVGYVITFDLTILHTNDVHARIEQMNKYGGTCSPDDAQEGKCFGGVARRFTKIREIRNTHPNVVLLDGGDQFQGTVWYNYYRGNASAYFINKLNYTVGVRSVHFIH